MFAFEHADADDPVHTAVLRWPSWRFAERDLGGIPEVVDPVRRMALIDISAWGGDRVRGWSHVLAHLDLDHHLVALGAFSPEQEADAIWLSRVRLGTWELQ